MEKLASILTVYIALFLCIMFGVYDTRADTIISIDKTSLRLMVISETDTIFCAPVCVGLNKGDKEQIGNNRTPEGKFTISQVQDSKKWKHDFKDGNGVRIGAYGPWFIRIKTPLWSTIGIHGTCFPESIGTRASEGCIRLSNEDLIRLMPLVWIGMPVIIHPDLENKQTNQQNGT